MLHSVLNASTPEIFPGPYYSCEVVHMLAERWQHLSNQLIATHVEFFENSCTTSYFDLGLNARVCFIAADFPPSDTVSHFAFLTPCLATYQCAHSSTVMFCASQATWKNPDWVLVQKYFTKNDYRKWYDKWNYNVSVSDGGNFSELSDSDTLKVHSPFSSSSSSEDEETVQPEPDKGRKKTRRALPKWADTDFELGWKEQIHMVQ